MVWGWGFLPTFSWLLIPPALGLGLCTTGSPLPALPRRQPGVPTMSQTYSHLPPQVPKANPHQAQQNEPSDCQGSQFGCCYDNVASAAGPLGEGCVGQPSYGEWMPFLILPGT